LKITMNQLREMIRQQLEERCQKGYKTHPKRKTKKMYGKTYRNCVKAESVIKERKDPHEVMGLLLKARYRLQDIKRAKDREKPEDLGVTISPALDKLEEELLELVDVLPSMLKF
tara:strand:- start:87 stop:428 length:342 start_codon:yes stop_codon:yes gene_type:complete